MPDLYLRKVRHPQAIDSHRVILAIEGERIEIGSIGVKDFSGTRSAWTWGIDSVIPMRSLETEGEGADLKDAMKRFKAAWQVFSADKARLTEFLDMKRRARRQPAKDPTR